MPILRGEIYFVELGPTRGKELDLKRRPVLVLSINDINLKPLVVTVVPGGRKPPDKPIYRHEVKVEPSESNGLEAPTFFQCFQIKALDHGRFDRPRAGVISDKDLLNIERTVQLCLGLEVTGG
jgi:mRNA-degrading endonuclease toxin of MazEF toxin-antitoxin module